MHESSHTHRSCRRTLLSLSLFLLTGCVPRDGEREPIGPPPPTRPVAQIIELVNHNGEQINMPLYGRVSASGKLVDDKGKSHKLDLGGRLAMQPPRSLFLRLDHALDSDQMEVGSNDTEYWLKLRHEARTLWWGRHVNIGKPCCEAMIVDPQLVADALGTSLLRSGADGRPQVKTERRVDRLIYDSNDGREPWRREYLVDRYPPHMIRSIIYKNNVGQVQMLINRSDYQSIGKDGPLIARKVEVQWPTKGSWMKLRIDSLESRTLNPATFVRPTNPSGVNRIVQVDADCDAIAAPAVGSAAAGGLVGGVTGGDGSPGQSRSRRSEPRP